MGQGPWNRWSFHHVRQILPTVEIARGQRPVRHLPWADRRLDDLPVAGTTGAAKTLLAFLTETYTDGIVVLTPQAKPACDIDGIDSGGCVCDLCAIRLGDDLF